MFVLNEFILNHLFQVSALASQPRQTIDYVLYKMKAVQIVLHAHVERGRDRAFLFVASNV